MHSPRHKDRRGRIAMEARKSSEMETVTISSVRNDADRIIGKKDFAIILHCGVILRCRSVLQICVP